ncbi:glutathione S-transferase U17-like [Nymphaea colorata]|nr:glutathione S-transferase U17-like [Nymphaea colorata]
MDKGGEVIKLIGTHSSPFVLRVKIALNLKNVPFEFLIEYLPYKKSQLLLDSNPVHKKVPVLLHDGRAICESLIILEYIDETWASCGSPILPSDPYDRAIARFWAAYIDEKLFPPFRAILTTEGEEQKAKVGQVVAALEMLEEGFGKCNKGGKFFGGQTIGLVDLILGSLVSWMTVMDGLAETQLLDPNKIPRLAAWAENFCEMPEVKGVLPEIAKLVEVGKGIQARERAAAAAASSASVTAIGDPTVSS